MSITIMFKDENCAKAEDIVGFISHYNKVTGEEGEPKDETIEELEERVSSLGTPEHRKKFEEWLEKECSGEFPGNKLFIEPHRLFRVRPNAPYRVSVPGTIVAPDAFKLCGCGECDNSIEYKYSILRSPAYWVGIDVAIDIEHLEEVTVEQLKQEETCSSQEVAQERA